MSYTRYNYNNNNNSRRRGRGPRNNFFIVGLLICIPLAIGIGMIFGPMIFKGKEGENPKAPVIEQGKETDKKDKPIEEIKETEPVKEGVKVENYYILQCGVYGKEENAKGILEKIPKGYNKFISKEEDKFRVIAGIYNEEESKKKAEELESEKIVNVRIRAEIKQEDSNSVKFSKITSGYIDILQKFDNEEVKSVNVEEFKKWVSELKGDDKAKEENEEVKKLKEHISKLPKEIKREDSEKSAIFLYNMLNKYRV